MQACFLNQQAAQPSAAEKSFHSSCGGDEPLITHQLLLQNRRALSGQGRCEGCKEARAVLSAEAAPGTPGKDDFGCIVPASKRTIAPYEKRLPADCISRREALGMD